MRNREHSYILRTAVCAVCATALCVIDSADVLPSTVPSTAPSVVKSFKALSLSVTQPADLKKRQVLALPKKYEILMTRSIFSRTRGPGLGGGDGLASTQPHKPGLVLRGVADQAGQRTALLEDTASGKTRQLHVGDEALGGKIVAITMEGIDRTLDGSVFHMGIGQSLESPGEIPGSTTRQSIALENGTTVVPEPATGSAIPAAATILQSPK